MSNLTKLKRERSISFLKTLSTQQSEDSFRLAINEIEDALSQKKYGLVWEEHDENADTLMKDFVPVFTEIKERELKVSENSNVNFLLEGDNLHSLLLLQKTHKNAIDIIYIDPPYNTENSLTYDDKRVGIDDFYRHSKWLSFMNRRLLLAKNLLKDDGLIFLSIDDNEAYQLKLLCDSIFEDSNFMGSFAVIKAEGGGMAKYIIKGHDLLLVYARNLSKAQPMGREKDIRGRRIIKDGIEYWIQEDWLRQEFGKYGNLFYEDLLKFRDQKFKDEIDKGIKDGIYTLLLKDDGRHIIGKLRRIDEDYSKYYSVIKHLNAAGKNTLASMGLAGLFDYPKPVSLIKDIVQGATFINKKEAVILDFFAGSGTTGQAVVEACKEDGKKRTFILCTNNEVSAIQKLNFCKKLGYLKDYEPNVNSTESAIESVIDKQLLEAKTTIDKLKNDNALLYESFGICQAVTYKRLMKIYNGYTAENKTDIVLYKKPLTLNNIAKSNSFISEIQIIEKKGDYDNYKVKIEENSLILTAEAKNNHKFPPIPFNLKYYKTDFVAKVTKNDDTLADSLLNHIKEMIQLENHIRLDNDLYWLMLDSEDLETLFDDETKIKRCKCVYMPSYILLDREQLKKVSDNGIVINTIPEYFFFKELREVGEV